MKATVVIISYNEEENIGRCISSVLRQDYKNFEMVIVNDGSTDRTEQIIEGFKDKRIKYTCPSKNLGYASARNSGLRLAKGSYVFFIDADCIAEQGGVREGIRFMDKNPKVVAASGKTLAVAKPVSNISSGYTYIKSPIRHKYFYPATMNDVYRKRVIECVGGFDERYNSGCEDINLGLKILKVGKVAYNERMIVSHYAKKMSLRRGVSLLRRHSNLVRLVKDHSRDFPFLRKSEICYGFVVAPLYFLAMIFPPFIIFVVKLKGRMIISIKDVAFLIPLYFALWYSWIIIWKTAISEKVFLI